MAALDPRHRLARLQLALHIATTFQRAYEAQRDTLERCLDARP